MSYGMKVWYSRAVEILGEQPFLMRDLPAELREHDHRVVSGYLRQLHSLGKAARIKRIDTTHRKSVWQWRLRV